jgi:hypothetical protein
MIPCAELVADHFQSNPRKFRSIPPVASPDVDAFEMR